MKHVLKIKNELIIIVLIFGLVVSCTKENDIAPKNGKIEFSFTTDNLKSGRTLASASALLVSVKDENGNYAYEKKKINLYNFDGDYISEPLSLKTGNFTLTEYLVLDKDDVVIYATPMEGSTLAHLVDDPLPIHFEVTQDQVVKITPQVIAVNSNKASAFGYATFSFSIVKTFNFSIAVFIYNKDLKNFELTESRLNILSDADTLFDGTLSDSTHLITLRDSLPIYHISIVKNGYATYEKSFTSQELQQYKDGKVLVIKLFNESLSDGLVAAYLFNGNASDNSGHNHNGQVFGASLTTDRKGLINAAYQFNGSSYISVANNKDINFADNDNFSISLWTLISATQNTEGVINDILRKWNGDSQGYPFTIGYMNNTAEASIQHKIITTRYDGSYCYNVPTSYSPVVSNNTFHHIVFMKADKILRQFIDNILVAEFTDNTSCGTTNNADMTIGSRGNKVRFFTGKIDDIRIYNRALKTTEIEELFKE